MRDVRFPGDAHNITFRFTVIFSNYFTSCIAFSRLKPPCLIDTHQSSMLRQSLKRMLQFDAVNLLSLAKEGSLLRGLPLHAHETVSQLPNSLPWDRHDRRLYTDGRSGDGKHPSGEPKEVQIDEALSSLQTASAVFQGKILPNSIENVDDALDAWGAAMDEGMLFQLVGGSLFVSLLTRLFSTIHNCHET